MASRANPPTVHTCIYVQVTTTYRVQRAEYRDRDGSECGSAGHDPSRLSSRLTPTASARLKDMQHWPHFWCGDQHARPRGTCRNVYILATEYCYTDYWPLYIQLICGRSCALRGRGRGQHASNLPVPTAARCSRTPSFPSPFCFLLDVAWCE